ncbi:MAG: hypothetical protein K2L30_03030 [Duncaniella sp.]|nr:hypothetical protein [Duncaniella sp.]
MTTALSINFIAYDTNEEQVDGEITPLDIVEEHCTTVYKVQEAFSSLNLPEGNVSKESILQTLYPEHYQERKSVINGCQRTSKESRMGQ